MEEDTRYDALIVGEGLDDDGFPVVFLEDARTKQEFCAYDPDVWQQRQNLLKEREEYYAEDE